MGGATLSRLLSGAVLMVYIARTLGPEEFGHFVLVFSLAMIMALLVEFGQSNYVMRELGRQPHLADQLLTSTLRSKSLLILVYVVFASIAWGLGVIQSGSELGYFCLCLTAIAGTLADFLNACFRGVERFKIETRNVILASLIHILVVTPVIWLTENWTHITVAFLVSRSTYLLITISSFNIVFKSVSQSVFALGWVADGVRQIRASFVYATDAALVTVRSYADVFLITTFLGTSALGLYQAGMNLVRAIENVGPIIANVYLPKLSGLLEKPRESARYEVQLLLLLLCCGLSCFGVFYLFPNRLLLIIFGERFAPSFVLFPFFGLYLLGRFVAMALGVILTAHGFQANRALAGLVSLGVLVLCAWTLTPHLGLSAMAVANVFSALILVVWFALRLRKGPPCARDAVSATVVIGTIVLIAYLLLGES